MAAVEFLAGRFRSLMPTLDAVESPFHLLGLLSTQQWLFLLVGYLAWTWDAFDYFSVSQVIKELAEQWGKSNIAIAVGLTVSLIPRFLGAAIFGLAADRFGRKWPFVVNCALLVILEMAIGFCNNYNQFVICRTLFGIAMGGLYGNATATALEDCPERARGLVSGIFQSGYAMGWLLATAFTKCFVDISQDRWRPLFWFGAGPPVLLIILRVCLPERAVYKAQNGASNDRDNIRGFFTDFNAAVSNHWRLLASLVAFMTGCSFLSHGSADIYDLMLSDKYEYTAARVRLTQIVGNVGAILGSAVIGFGSQIIGRRFAITIACILGGLLIYPYFFVSDGGLYAAVFWEQFMIQGIFGVVPIHLIELSPPAFRTFVVGTSYNLGVAFASPIPIIDTEIGKTFPILQNGAVTQRFNYSIGMAIFLGCAFAYLIIATFLGEEKRGTNGAGDSEHEPDEVELGLAVIVDRN